jgi:hypothetical protein
MAIHPDLLAAHAKLRAAWEEVAKLEVHALQAIKKCSSLEDLADAAYCCRLIEDTADDIRKRTAETGQLCQRIACALAVATEQVDSIRTDYVTATPDVKMIASIPRRSTHLEQFAALMAHFGVPASAWEGGEHAAVQPHWPGVMERINRDLAAGKPLPPGVDPDKTYPEYRLLMRKGKRTVGS